MPAEKSPEQRTIAQLNDEFRRNRRDWYITRGAQSLPDVPGLVEAVRQFNTFTPDNDPTPSTTSAQSTGTMNGHFGR